MQMAPRSPSSRPFARTISLDGRRVGPLVGIVLMAAVVCLVLLMPGQARGVTFDEEELGFLRLINEYRAANGRGALLLSPQLSLSAERHAQDMGNYRYFSHDTQSSDYYPAGTEYWQRLEKDGYSGGSSGENLAAGPSGASEVFGLWRNSPGHNANMLDPVSSGSRVIFREIGIARTYVPGSPFGWYWVTDFGGTLDATAYNPFQDLGGPFTDVPKDHAFAAAIECLKDQGVVGGYSDGRFGLFDTVRRAQFAKVVVELLELHTDDLEYASHRCLRDLTPGVSYPHDYVEEAYHAGVTKGLPSGGFGAYNNITRAQLALMLVRAAGDQLADPPAGWSPGFTDIGKLSAEFQNAIAKAKYHGLINGKSASTFDPNSNATRGHMAKMSYELQAKMEKAQTE